jgi:E-phenylitaconyl-CoA hydratase
MAIDFEVSEEGVALIRLNRPERLNAMDAEHYEALSRAWCTVRDDPAIRVAIVTGAGERSFTTGADIKSFLTAPTDLSMMWLTQKDQLLNRGLEVWKPVIAAVNGYCLGGGMTLMLATDIRLASPHATFSLAEVKRGVIPGNGGTQRVLQQLPYPIAMELPRRPCGGA